MQFPNLTAPIGRFVQDNVSTILTAGGVVGTVTTAMLTGRASVGAYKAIVEKELERAEAAGYEGTEIPALDQKEKFLIAAPHFVPPVVVGAATVAAIVAAHQVSAKEAAVLAAAYGVSQKQLDEYKAKVQQKLTGPKNQQIKDEIAQDRVTNNPPSEVIILADGDVLCHDMITGRYFRSTVERIRKAMALINSELNSSQYASLSQFYDEIGLPPTDYTDTVGWSALNQDTTVEVELTTTMTPDDKPCIAVNFNILPTPDFTRLY